MENQSQAAVISFVERQYSKILLIEKTSVVLLIVGIFFYQFLNSNYTVFIVTGSVIGAITFFLLSYRFIEEENHETTGILNSIGFINFMYKLAYYSFAVGCLAMLGLVANFKGNILMVTSGLTLIVILFISLMTKVNDRTVIYNSSFYTRVLLFLGMLGYLALVDYGKI